MHGSDFAEVRSLGECKLVRVMQGLVHRQQVLSHRAQQVQDVDGLKLYDFSLRGYCCPAMHARLAINSED